MQAGFSKSSDTTTTAFIKSKTGTLPAELKELRPDDEK